MGRLRFAHGRWWTGDLQSCDHLLHLCRGQPHPPAQQVHAEVELAENLDLAHHGTGPAATGKHQQRHHFRRRQPLPNQHRPHRFHLRVQLVDSLVRASLAPPQPAMLDPSITPRLHIDDEHPARTDQQHVDIGPPRPRPAPVRQHRPAGVHQVDQHPDGPLLPDGPDPESALPIAQLTQHPGQAVELALYPVDLQPQLSRFAPGRPSTRLRQRPRHCTRRLEVPHSHIMTSTSDESNLNWIFPGGLPVSTPRHPPGCPSARKMTRHPGHLPHRLRGQRRKPWTSTAASASA